MRNLIALALLVTICSAGPARAERRPKRDVGIAMMFLGTAAVIAGAITTVVGLGVGTLCPDAGSCSGRLGTVSIAGIATLASGVATSGSGVALYAVDRRQTELAPAAFTVSF